MWKGIKRKFKGMKIPDKFMEKITLAPFFPVDDRFEVFIKNEKKKCEFRKKILRGCLAHYQKSLQSAGFFRQHIELNLSLISFSLFFEKHHLYGESFRKGSSLVPL